MSPPRSALRSLRRGGAAISNADQQERLRRRSADPTGVYPDNQKLTAEFYNGLGSRQRGETNPYVYSGTDQYTSGKFFADGRYSSSTKDGQVGELPLVQSVSGGTQL